MIDGTFFFPLMQGQIYQVWQQQPERLAPATGDGLLGGDESWQPLRDI